LIVSFQGKVRIVQQSGNVRMLKLFVVSFMSVATAIPAFSVIILHDTPVV